LLLSNCTVVLYFKLSRAINKDESADLTCYRFCYSIYREKPERGHKGLFPVTAKYPRILLPSEEIDANYTTISIFFGASDDKSLEISINLIDLFQRFTFIKST